MKEGRKKTHLGRKVQSHVPPLLFPPPAFLSGTLSLCKHFPTGVEKTTKKTNPAEALWFCLEASTSSSSLKKVLPLRLKGRAWGREEYFLSTTRLIPFSALGKRGPEVRGYSTSSPHQICHAETESPTGRRVTGLHHVHEELPGVAYGQA